jgi:hypothetical protein
LFGALAFRTQAQAIQIQAEAFSRQQEELRRAQASHISIWEEHVSDEAGPPWVDARLRNTSGDPIYGVEVRWQANDVVTGEPDRQQVLPPGSEILFHRELPPDVSPDLFHAAVRFRDAKGITWLRRPDGTLSEDYGTLFEG